MDERVVVAGRQGATGIAGVRDATQFDRIACTSHSTERSGRDRHAIRTHDDHER
jgi:hypothetical protein